MSRMNVQYDRQINEEEIEEDPYYFTYNRELTTRPHALPTSIGIFQIISGFISAILGTFEVFIVPMAEASSDERVLELSKQNCYGAGLWGGLLMILTGSTAIRASISKRNTTVARFYNLTIVTFFLYMCVTVFLMVAYGQGWTTKDKYPPGSNMHMVHLFVTVNSLLGLLFALTALVKYFNIVFSDSVDLLRRWRNWFLCCFPRQSQTQPRQEPNLLM
ncbi:hypothetical protein LOTGIDRAFT_236799 [Lottia gigantea]|uniref:MARVEL domain-containing protein n=1 Tax=Lottia gigantea TaxID=225164 RepID=V3YYJ1_LOTGI|nr:hypothetical protein LOTGIDRAFT_236799 [Lottia gigantea]ESO83213.1 hypothetical protein LOTGIDRAFT_236799 [Lottia gigantea]